MSSCQNFILAFVLIQLNNKQYSKNNYESLIFLNRIRCDKTRSTISNAIFEFLPEGE